MIKIERNSTSQNSGLHFAIVNTDYFKLHKPEGLVEAIKYVANQVGAKFTFFGASPQILKNKLAAHGIKFIDCFIPNRKEFLEFIGEHNFNAALVPLDVSIEHSYKSDIKFLDFASLKVAGIYNNPDVYNRVVDKKNGLICHDSKESWIEAMLTMNDRGFREKIGANAHEDALSRDISTYANRMIDIAKAVKK